MKQTAVEWLVEQLENHSGVTRAGFNDVINQAKQMEKEQIIEALQEFLDITLPNEVCEQYYNETFKSE